MLKKAISIFLCLVIAFSFSLTAFAATPNEKPYENSSFYCEGDYTIHYRSIMHSGEFKGRIMMLHGFGQSSYAWQNMAALLSGSGYDCYMADLPGFGYSSRESEETNHIDREVLIENLMMSIHNGDDWILAGHSMGGGVAINIAQDIDLGALMLFCPAPTSELPKAAEPILTSDFCANIMEFVLKYLTKIDFLMRLVVLAATVDVEFTKNYNLGEVTTPLQQNGTGRGLCTMMSKSRKTDLENAGKIACPVLLVNADEDFVLMPNMKNQVSQALPGAITYTVKKAGHLCIENRAYELAQTAKDFLNG